MARDSLLGLIVVSKRRTPAPSSHRKKKLEIYFNGYQLHPPSQGKKTGLFRLHQQLKEGGEFICSHHGTALPVADQSGELKVRGRERGERGGIKEVLQRGLTSGQPCLVTLLQYRYPIHQECPDVICFQVLSGF